MDINEFMQKLPTKPREGMLEWALDRFKDSELGGEYLLFKRVSVDLETVPVTEYMSPADWEAYDKGLKSRWAAECKCSACYESFIAGWNKKDKYSSKRKGIRLKRGEDETLFYGYIPEKYDPYDDFEPFSDIVTIYDGEELYCPLCEEQVQLISPERLRYGRTFQLMIVSVEVVDGVAVLMTWMIRRRFDEDGYSSVSVRPYEAIAIDGRRFYRFAHVKFNSDTAETYLDKWEPREYRGEDLTCRKYYNYESYCHRKTGAALWHDLPDLTGTTGEKTALAEYIKGCDYEIAPFAYIRFWKKHPTVENIIKSEWRDIVDSMLEDAAGRNYQANMTYGVEASEVIDFREKKPHKMLGITKEESKIRFCWNYRELEAYQLQNSIEPMSVSEFSDYLTVLGTENVSGIVNLSSDGEPAFRLRKVSTYILKQVNKYETETFDDTFDDYTAQLIDYRAMLHNTAEAGHVFTEEELFPKNLYEAHDRLVEIQEIKAHEKYKKAFRRLEKKYAPLAYNDGELCIFVCPNETELIKEGDTLRHCVGGYGHSHTEESDVIFFVRHYRRPERSYYTLDIKMNGAVPKRVQLHGYGNERHGPNKEHRHSIPQKVLNFVDKWEKEVLIPMWKAGKLKEKEQKKNGKSDDTAA